MITSSFSSFKSGGMVVNASAVIYLALSTSSGESGTLMLYSLRLIIIVLFCDCSSSRSEKFLVDWQDMNRMVGSMDGAFG